MHYIADDLYKLIAGPICLTCFHESNKTWNMTHLFFEIFDVGYCTKIQNVIMAYKAYFEYKC